MRAFAALATRLQKAVLLLINRYRTTSAERTFIRRLNGPPRFDGDGSLVLVEAVEDHYYLALFAHVVAGIAAEQPIRVEAFVPRSLRPGCVRSVYQAFKSVCFYNTLTDRKWVRLYSHFCNRVAYRSAGPLLSRACATDLLEARRIWKTLESKELLVKLKISDIEVGDLIYDTYLRFKPAATVDLKSRYLWLVIWQTMRDLRAARAYMFGVRPKLFLTSYSAYIQHGVAVRVALAAGVEVFSFGNYQEFSKRLRLTDWVHTRNPDDYRLDFARIEDSDSKMAKADAALTARMSGTIDAATAYMRQSAYSGSVTLPEGVSGSLVLYLHDFFDSPHCYRWMIFPDFLEWATFTLELARQAGIKVFVKPHPNQIASSKTVVRNLMREYPEATWLSTGTSNLQLAEAGAACAVTVYGTVAHEMAYLGIPTIAAGHNPHIAFSICHTAQNRDEYRQLILNYRNLPRPREKLRRESLEFYCMHNLSDAPEEARLRATVIRFRRLVADNEWLSDGADFSTFAAELNAEPAFRKACRDLAKYLTESDDEPQCANATDAREQTAAI